MQTDTSLMEGAAGKARLPVRAVIRRVRHSIVIDAEAFQTGDLEKRAGMWSLLNRWAELPI